MDGSLRISRKIILTHAGKISAALDADVVKVADCELESVCA